MASTSTPHAKVHPQLAAACIKTHQEVAYRAWTYLRAMDANGQSRATFDETLAILSQTMTRQQAYKVLRNPIFFARVGNYVEMRGLDRVCNALGTRPGRGVFIPLASLENQLIFNSFCLSARFSGAGHSKRLVAQGTLARHYGRTPKTLRRWCRIAGIHVERNVHQSERPRTLDAEMREAGWFLGQGTETRTLEGQLVTKSTTVLYRRLPNSYQSDLPEAPKGNIRKIKVQPRSKPVYQTNCRRAKIQMVHLDYSDVQAFRKGKLEKLKRAPDGDVIYAAVGNKQSKFGRVWSAHMSLMGGAPVL